MIGTIKSLLRRIKAHNVTVTAAGIAFYGLLALVPTLIALVSVYSLVADPADIEQQVTDVAGSLDNTTRDFVVAQLTDIVGEVEQDAADGEQSANGGAVGRWSALALGIALALFSASGAVQKLMATIAVAYEAEEHRAGWKVRGLAYLFTAAAIVGIAAMIMAIGVAPAVLDTFELGEVTEAVINIARLPVLGLLFVVALTVLYRYSPDRPHRTPWRNPGAVVGTLLFVLFAVGFSFYTSSIGALPASYGLLGSIAALMIFLQLTALSVIIGAEVNAIVETRRAGISSKVALQPVSKPGASIGHGDSPVGNRQTDDDSSSDDGPGDSDGQRPVSFGKALAGLVALFALGRAGSR